MVMSGLMATSIKNNLCKMMADKQTGIKQTTRNILSNIGSNRIIYVPQALMIKRRGDPEQLARDWKEYIQEFKTFPRVSHNKPGIAGCRNAKVLLRLEGGVKVRKLLNLAGRVTDTDSWEVTLTKI